MFAGGTSITQWISQPTLKSLKVPSTSRTVARLNTYNAMILPLRYFDFDGVVWYQVCSKGVWRWLTGCNCRN